MLSPLAVIVAGRAEAEAAAVAPKQFSLFHAYAIEEWPVAKVMKTYGVTRDQVYQAKRRVGKVFTAAVQEAERTLDRPL